MCIITCAIGRPAGNCIGHHRFRLYDHGGQERGVRSSAITGPRLSAPAGRGRGCGRGGRWCSTGVRSVGEEGSKRPTKTTQVHQTSAGLGRCESAILYCIVVLPRPGNTHNLKWNPFLVDSPNPLPHDILVHIKQSCGAGNARNAPPFSLCGSHTMYIHLYTLCTLSLYIETICEYICVCIMILELSPATVWDHAHCQERGLSR